MSEPVAGTPEEMEHARALRLLTEAEDWKREALRFRKSWMEELEKASKWESKYITIQYNFDQMLRVNWVFWAVNLGLVIAALVRW